jgi:hypothetical protein
LAEVHDIVASRVPLPPVDIKSFERLFRRLLAEKGDSIPSLGFEEFPCCHQISLSLSPPVFCFLAHDRTLAVLKAARQAGFAEFLVPTSQTRDRT